MHRPQVYLFTATVQGAGAPMKLAGTQEEAEQLCKLPGFSRGGYRFEVQEGTDPTGLNTIAALINGAVIKDAR